MGGGIGFIDYLNLFCWGDMLEEVEENVKVYLFGVGIGVKKVFGKMMLVFKQDLVLYIFFEQICGLFDLIVMKVIRFRGYFDCIVEDILKMLCK